MFNKQIELKESEFSEIRKLIYKWAGISLTDNKRALVSGRLLKRIRNYKLNSFDEYIQKIKNSEEEKQIFINLLSTNETYFFREPKHFDYLRDQIIPMYQSTRKIRVWSAASSSGEEIYTIAMVLAEYHNGPWEIFGSDINEEMLHLANRAVYPMEDAVKIPEKFLKKYCLKGVKSQEGFFTIDKSLKKNIRFMKINLNQNLPDIGQFDIIFLRNVMIYFNRETKMEILNRLIPKLGPDGYFIVGHAENLHGLTTDLMAEVPTIYRRK